MQERESVAEPRRGVNAPGKSFFAPLGATGDYLLGADRAKSDSAGAYHVRLIPIRSTLFSFSL
jgi:hypothetical protein